MLAAIIANLQNVPEAQERLPTVRIDRGGGGATWPGYEITDVMTAIRLFPEIPGEDSVTRAVRRTRWIGEALPRIKEARERRDAAVFLAGAVVADAAAEERHKLIDQLKIEQLVEIVDAVRTASVPIPGVQPPRQRGQHVVGTSPLAIVLAFGAGAALCAIFLRRS